MRIRRGRITQLEKTAYRRQRFVRLPVCSVYDIDITLHELR